MCEFDEYFMTLICGSYVDVNSVCFFFLYCRFDRGYFGDILFWVSVYFSLKVVLGPLECLFRGPMPPSKPIYGQPVLSMQFYLCAKSIVKMEILPEDFY